MLERQNIKATKLKLSKVKRKYLAPVQPLTLYQPLGLQINKINLSIRASSFGRWALIFHNGFILKNGYSRYQFFIFCSFEASLAMWLNVCLS